MCARQIETVVIIGAGNLAAHLGSALVRAGVTVIQVVNRSPVRGVKLAKKLGAAFTTNFESINQSADLYIVAVSDHAIAMIAGMLRLSGRFVVHTSGTTDMDVLMQVTHERGVFYPLQTFSGKRAISFRKIPLCIEAVSSERVEQLAGLARRLSSVVYGMNSDQRKILHLSAVIACNFTNFMFTISKDLLKKNDIPFELLGPLIKQTANNWRAVDIFSLQTGPAVRGDQQIMDEHRQLLSEIPDYQDIYNLISNNIIKYKKKNG
jgi:predicted short-subunit dehydrogenase-like oxidoreductase (DUF2520 family)